MTGPTALILAMRSSTALRCAVRLSLSHRHQKTTSNAPVSEDLDAATTGIRNFQANFWSWSSRRRGNVDAQPDHQERPAHRSCRGTRTTRGSSSSGSSSGRAVPAAEEQHGGDARRSDDDARVLGEQEQGEPHARVLGHVPEMISESAIGMSNGGRVSSASAPMKNRTKRDEPYRDGQTRRTVLRLDDVDQRQRARLHRDRRGGEHQRELVGDQLRGRAERADQRELVRARPAGHQHPDDADRRDGEHEEQPRRRGPRPNRRPRARVGIDQDEDRGITGSSATAGASANTRGRRPRGMMSSFWTNLMPSASSCAQPWNLPASIGPSRACMCASPLCST